MKRPARHFPLAYALRSHVSQSPASKLRVPQLPVSKLHAPKLPTSLRRVLTVLLAAVLAIALAPSGLAAFIQADIQIGSTSSGEKAHGGQRSVAFAAPTDTGEPMDSSVRGLTARQIDTTAEIPASYSLTNLDEVTPVKLQNPWGDCWAFAIASALESSILKAEKKLASQKTAEESEDATQTQDAEEATPIQDATETAAAAAAPRLLALNERIDLSERAIAWFAHELQTETSGGVQSGEGYQLKDLANPHNQLAEGNFKMVESLLASGQALIAESSAAYQYNDYAGDPPWYSLGSYDGAPDDARMRDWSVDESLRTTEEVGWAVNDIYKLDPPAKSTMDPQSGLSTYEGYDANATLEMKQALMDIGGIAIAIDNDTAIPSEVAQGNFNAASPTEHFSYATWSQYNASEVVDYNHAVTIVGWDDTFSAANFSGTASGQPPADGAWLCKNNWGSDALYNAIGAAEQATHWGIRADSATGLPAANDAAATEASGFFWLSYYDHSIQDPTVFAVRPTSETLDTTYQYDYLGSAEYLKPSTYTGDVWVGNVFTASSVELLRALSVETFAADETVDVEVYSVGMASNAEDAEDVVTNQDLTKMTRLASASSTFANAGFHTLKLDRPVLLTEGQRFFVACKTAIVENGEEGSYLSLEIAYIDALDLETSPFKAHVVSNPGESFMSIEPGVWFEISPDDPDFEQNVLAGDNFGIVFGNALVKAYTDAATFTESGQLYKTMQLS